MIDSHAHYTDAWFNDDFEELLKKIDDSNEIELVIEASTSINDSKRNILISENFGKFFSVVGIHPSDADEVNEGWEDELRKLANHKKVVGIGEIGLDYHYDNVDKAIQIEVFEKQLNIARELGLPVVIHDREAHKDCIDMCIKSGVRGVFHSFSGSIESAKILMSKGDWYFSFNGICTFKNASNVHEVIRRMPIERMLVETDCPYLAPVPHRGKRNDSFLMRHTIEQIAILKETSFETIEKITSENTKRLFSIS